MIKRYLFHSAIKNKAQIYLIKFLVHCDFYMNILVTRTSVLFFSVPFMRFCFLYCSDNNCVFYCISKG